MVVNCVGVPRPENIPSSPQTYVSVHSANYFWLLIWIVCLVTLCQPLSTLAIVFVQTKRKAITLNHLVTHDRGITSNRSTVMPSGLQVFWDATTELSPPAFRCYRATGSGLSLETTLPGICTHNTLFSARRKKLFGLSSNSIKGILDMKVGGKELLAVSCSKCRSISLLNLVTGDISKAFSHPKHNPRIMCQGKPGQMFCSTTDRSVILQLDCSSQNMELVQVIKRPMGLIRALTYIPEHKLLTVSWPSDESNTAAKKAISVDTKKTVWKAKGKPADSLAYCAMLEVLFAAISDRIVVLDVKNGSEKEVLPLPGDVGAIRDLCIHGDQLIASTSQKVMCFKISTVHHQLYIPK